jgi:hypothetical protein
MATAGDSLNLLLGVVVVLPLLIKVEFNGVSGDKKDALCGDTMMSCFR